MLVSQANTMGVRQAGLRCARTEGAERSGQNRRRERDALGGIGPPRGGDRGDEGLVGDGVDFRGLPGEVTRGCRRRRCRRRSQLLNFQPRIASRIAEHEAQIQRIEREIRDYGADARIAAVERERDAYDADGKVAAIERRIRDLDADRRIAELETRQHTELTRLEAAVTAVR